MTDALTAAIRAEIEPREVLERAATTAANPHMPARGRAAPERLLLPPYGPATAHQRATPCGVGAQACAPVRTAHSTRAGLSRDWLTGPQPDHSRSAVHEAQS